MFHQQQEELEIEWNSQFDYVSEAYGETARDCNEMARQDGIMEALEAAAFIGPHKPFDWGNPY